MFVSGRLGPVFYAWLVLLAAAITAGVIWVGFVEAPPESGGHAGPGTMVTMGQGEWMRLADAWGSRSGFIVWSSAMHGPHQVVRFDWPSGRLIRLTHGTREDRLPRISPDGSRLVFVRARNPEGAAPSPPTWDVWLLDMHTLQERRLAENATDPSWTEDGRGVVFQRGGREVVRVDVATGEETPLLAARSGVSWENPSLDPRGDWLAVTARERRQRSLLVPLNGGDDIGVGLGSFLAFAPGGDWLIMSDGDRRARPRILRIERDGTGARPLLSMSAPWRDILSPRISNDGLLLVFSAGIEDRTRALGRSEIFIWRLGDPPEDAARVSFHTGSDLEPDVWVKPER